MTELFWWVVGAILGASLSLEYSSWNLEHGLDLDANSGCMRRGYRILFDLMIFLIKVLVNTSLNGVIQRACRITVVKWECKRAWVNACLRVKWAQKTNLRRNWVF